MEVGDQRPEGPQRRAQVGRCPLGVRKRLGQREDDRKQQDGADGGEHQEHRAPGGERQQLAADDGRHDRGDAVDDHEGGEEPGHGGAGEQVPHDGPRQDRARGRTQRLQYPAGDQVADGGRQRAPQRPRQVQRHTGKQRAAPAPCVRQWTDDYLEEGQADDERREGHLNQRRAGVQLVSHARHGG